MSEGKSKKKATDIAQLEGRGATGESDASNSAIAHMNSEIERFVNDPSDHNGDALIEQQNRLAAQEAHVVDRMPERFAEAFNKKGKLLKIITVALAFWATAFGGIQVYALFTGQTEQGNGQNSEIEFVSPTIEEPIPPQPAPTPAHAPADSAPSSSNQYEP